MSRRKKALVQAPLNVQKHDLISITSPMINRMRLEEKSMQTIKSYSRAVQRLVKFHDTLHPKEMELDEVLDFLVSLKDKDQVNWRTNKMYVAGLRYFWTHVLEDPDFAFRIPYPKEQPSLPKILSRKELSKLFDACRNIKHRTILRLIYSSGLRRSELIHLRIQDIETDHGKCRVKVVKGKGKKDRYTVLSKSVLLELREYYTIYKPKEYLFNGRRKGDPISEAAIAHIIKNARKRSGIAKDVTMHILRHCFATHALEHGMPINRLQNLLGHSSLQTTLIYLHVSDLPLVEDFSPLDIWEDELQQ